MNALIARTASRMLVVMAAAAAVHLFIPAAVEAAVEEPVIVSDGSLCIANPKLSAAPDTSEEAGIPDLIRTVRIETLSKPADANCESPETPCTGPDCRQVECSNCNITVTYFLPDNPQREFRISMRRPVLQRRTNVRLQGKRFSDFERVGPRRNLRLRDAKIRSIEVQGQPRLDCGAKPCRLTVTFETTQ